MFLKNFHHAVLADQFQFLNFFHFYFFFRRQVMLMLVFSEFFLEFPMFVVEFF